MASNYRIHELLCVTPEGKERWGAIDRPYRDREQAITKAAEIKLVRPAAKLKVKKVVR
jgi:hypothetical protein